MQVLIVDDEDFIIEGIKKLLEFYEPEWEIVGTCKSLMEFQAFDKTLVDLVFLDINLKDGLSIKYLSQFDDITFKVIFITAHDNYAVDAFRLSATDYLLKPIDPEEFQQAIQKIRMQKALKVDVLNQMYSDESNVENHKIVLNTQSDIFVLPVKELMYLKAEGSYTTFYFLDQKIVVSKNLKEYEGPLLKRGFFRSHHSYLVNLSFARKFNKDHSTIDLGKNIFIPVSSRKKDALLNAMRLS